jgi:hypothetical protein
MNKEEIKTFEQLKEELGNNYDKLMYDMNLELINKLEKSNNKIEKIKEYIDNNYWCWENDSGKPADSLSIIDGSDE